MFQIPFKFYLGKEFVFILIDEWFHKSISIKIDHLKKITEGEKNRLYSETMIKKVQDDLYKIVRMPYMRYSNCQYYSIAISTYAFNIIIVVLLRTFYKGDENSNTNPV